MKKKKTRLRYFILAALLFAVVSMLSANVYAAKTVSVLDGAISITDSSGNGEASAGTVTITAISTSKWSKTTNNITIKNSSGYAATVSFSYSVDNCDSHTFGSQTTGNISQVLTAGEELSYSITSKRNSTATLTLSSFSIEAIPDTYNYTFSFDGSLGSVTANEIAVTNGTAVALPTSGATIVATPKSGVSFLGWIDADSRTLISSSATYSLTLNDPRNVQAAFYATEPWFSVGEKIYEGLSAAVEYAATVSTKTVVLLNDGTLPAGKYTIPAGVTLLIPYNSSNTLCTTKPTTVKPGNFSDAVPTPTAYRTLTMASGAHITVNGAISLSGQHRSGGRYAGCVTGATSYIKMAESSSITLNSGGKLYAWGYITGSGKVEALSGSEVYEDFQITDWRGGDMTKTMASDTTHGIFPMSQYYVQNIEVPLYLYAGAKETAVMSVNISLIGIQMISVDFMGGSGYMFNLQSGYAIKDYDESRDRMDITICGNVSVDPIELEMKLGLLGSTKVKSKNLDLPINGHTTLTLQSGTVTINQDMAFLPGSEVLIDNGATCTLGEGVSIYIYDGSTWGTYCGSVNVKLGTLPYAPGRANPTQSSRTEASLVDAKVVVNGTIDATKGYIYTTYKEETDGGANVCSEGTGVVMIGARGTQTATYQVIQAGEPANSTYVAISLTPAKLKHSSGSFVPTGNSTTNPNTYTYTDGYWRCATHSNVTSVEKDATCTSAGIKSTICAVCALSKTEAIPALGHAWGDWVVDNNTHVCTSTCAHDKDHTISVLLEYRMNSYIWLNATVSSTAGEQPVCSNTDIVYKQYLVKKVLSNELTSSIEVTFTLDGTTPTLDVGFLAYKNAIYGSASDETQTLLTAMENYGKAADVYFDTDGSGATGLGFGNLTCTNKQGVTVIPGTNAMGKQFDALNGYTVNGETYTVKSLGASFFFDECITLRMNYAMHYTTENETKFFDGILQGNDTIAQIGVLVGNTADYLKLTGAAELRADAGKYDEAYILYGPGTQGKDDNIPEVPGYTGSEEDEPIETVDFGALYVNFDLKSTEYAKQFALRPFIVINHGGKTEDTSDDTYTVLYGEQYLYGLENYVYNICTNDEYDSVEKITAFRDFLVRTWDYALAADAKYN